MTPDDVAAQVGLLAMMQGNYDAAAEFYEAALEENPNNANALIGIADLHKFADRYDEAAPLYERALALEPNDAEHLLDYGEYLLDRAQVEPSADARRQLLVEARRQFARSYQLDPSNPETLSQNGVSYLFEGEDVAKGVRSLEQAYDLLPSQLDIQVALAQAYLAARDTGSARELLERLIATTHAELAEQLEKLLANLPAVEADGETAAAAGE
jgi:tetratricopeptide (TPR) repeat protein